MSTLQADFPRILRAKQVCEATGLPRTSLNRAVQEGDFPKPVPLFPGKPKSIMLGWREADVRAWIESRFQQVVA